MMSERHPQFELTQPQRVERLESDIVTHVEQCTAQARWFVGILITVILGLSVFLYNVSSTLTEVKTTVLDMSRAQSQDHEERMRYDQSQAAAAGDQRRLIDGLQQQLNDVKVSIGPLLLQRDRELSGRR